MRYARAVPLVAVVVLTACTGTPPAAAPSTPAAPVPSASTPGGGPGSGSEWTATSTRGAAPAPAAAGGRLRLTREARVALPARMRVAGLALGGTRIAWSGCAPCAGAAQDPTDVFVADLPAGPARAVARSRFRWGSTRVVGFSGDVLVWLDGADVRDGGVPHAQWALRAVDLRSGASWTIADGGRAGDPPQTTVAFAGSGRVTWQLFDLATARGPVRTADLRTRTVRTLHTALPGRLRGVTSRGLVHTANDPAVRTVVPDAPVPVDAYLTPADGGAATALTTTHDVADAAAGADHVLWSTHQGTGETLWSVPVTGAGPTRLFSGPVLTFSAGRGFAAWTTRESDPVVQLGAGGRPLTLPDVPAEGGVLATDGDRLALLTVPARAAAGPATVMVVRVAPGR